jgi:hypothetical protein
MSTNNSNNGNVSGGTIYISGGGGGGGTATSGTWTINTSYPVQWITHGFINPKAEPAKTEKKKDRDGCDCKKCKEFYPYSEPNQEDGTLICYACRHGY